MRRTRSFAIFREGHTTVVNRRIKYRTSASPKWSFPAVAKDSWNAASALRNLVAPEVGEVFTEGDSHFLMPNMFGRGQHDQHAFQALRPDVFPNEPLYPDR